MRRLWLPLLPLAFLLLPPHAAAQSVGSFQQWCVAGGQMVGVSGIQSVNPFQASYPRCQVNVYLTGTTTTATIYSTSTLTPLQNPFCANLDGSFLFYASQSGQYDVVMSNSNACNPPPTYAQLPASFTFFDAAVSGTGGGGGGNVPVGPQYTYPISTGIGFTSQVPVFADTANSSIVADGTTDTCTTFQAWINAHPGQRLMVRKVAAATQGGGTASTIDYYSSCTLHLTYNGTVLEGVPNDDWQGAPVILFAAGVTGIQIDPSCFGCAIKNMEIAGGGKPYASGLACYNSNNTLLFPFTGSADGILVYGGEPTIEHTIAECFTRDAIHIDGTNVSLNGYVGQPDYWKVLYGQGNSSQHSGLYIHGGDTNDGSETLFNTYGNGGTGVEDDSTSSTSHRNTGTQGNGRDANIAAQPVSNLSSISCTTFTCSVVTAAPVTGIQSSIWVVIAGTTNYNGVHYVTGYNDSQHFSFAWVAPSAAAETSGTVGVDGSTHMFANAVRTVSDAACTGSQTLLTSQSAQFGKDTQVGATINIAGAGSAGSLLSTTIASVTNEYSVTLAVNCATTVSSAQASFGGGISHTPIMANGNSTWISPYWESNQPTANMAGTTVIIGGNLSTNGSYGTPLTFQSISSGYGVLTTQNLEIVDPVNSAGGAQVQCGLNANQDCGFTIFNYNQSAQWKMYAVGSSNDQEFFIRDGSSGGVIPFQTTHGSTTGIVAATNIFLTAGVGYQIQTANQIASTLIGSPPFVVASNIAVANLNASLLLGGTWASPGAAIGTGTAVAGTFTALTDTALAAGVGNCVQVGTGGLFTYTASPCGSSGGSVTTTGSPSNGELTKFTGASSISNGNLSGDATTSNTLVVTVVGLNGTNLGGLATGLLKNTTSTGVPTIAVAGTDYVIPSGSITGNAATATALSAYTGYSIYGSAATTGSWITPTANGQCLMSGASSYASTIPSFQSCPGGGGGGMTWPTNAGIAVYAGSSAWGPSITTLVPVPPGSSQSAIQALLSAASPGEELLFSDTYTACGLTLSVSDVTLYGLNQDGTSIQCATASSPVLTVSGSGDQVDGMTFKHITNSPTCPGGNGTSTCGDGLQIAGGASRAKIINVHTNFNYNGIALGYTTYSEYSNSVSEYNNNHGVVFVMSSSTPNMQWQVSRILSEQNLGNGFDMTCPASFSSIHTPGPYFTGWTTTYGNAGYGYNFSCSAATASGISDVWMSAVFASTNNNSGFNFDFGSNGGRNNIVSGVYSEQNGAYTGPAGFAQTTQSASNVGSGINITSACDNTTPPSITGGVTWQNSYSGITTACPGTSISNISAFDNGFASASPQTEAGVTINATNVQVNGGYLKKGTTEIYGVYVQSGDTPSIFTTCDSSISVGNCVYSGSQPTNGYQQRFGQARYITGTGVPGMTCTNGDKYERTDAGNFATDYSCSNNAWTTGSGGGFTNPMTTLGDMIYENGTPTAARLAGSTSATMAALTQTGTGSISAVPAWILYVGGGTNPVAATVSGAAQGQILVYNSSGVLINAYSGVNVDSQTGNYALSCPLDRLGEIEFNISAPATLTLPQVGSTACLGSNIAFAVRNTASSTATLTITATTSTFQPENVASHTILPGAGLLVYSDASSGTGNYHALEAPASFGGVNTQTGTYTLNAGDRNKMILMNCSSSCSVILPATPPNSSWTAWISSIGSTTPTVSLNGLNYNGGASAPILLKYVPIAVRTDGSNYFGDAPLVAGTGISFGNAGNGLTINVGSFPLSSLTAIANNTLVANFTSGSASPVAYAMASCSGSNDAEIYTTNTGLGCGTNFAQLNVVETFSALQTFGAFASIGATAHGVLLSENTGAVVATAAGTSGYPLLSGGSIADGAYAQLAIGGIATSSINGTDTKLQSGTGSYTTSNMACGDANGGVTPCTTTPTDMVLGNGVTATTQTAGDASTLVATDAFVATGISNAIAAVNPAVAVLAASTASLIGTYANGASGVGATFTVTATGAFTLDGVSIGTIGQRVLLKNQSSAFQNGIYIATVVGTTGISPVFTRALDYDQPSDMNNTGSIPVQSGTVNAATSWLQTSTVNTVGTDAVTFTQFSVSPSNLVTAASPGVGIAHFAGSTQAVTSSLIVAADITANTITSSQVNSTVVTDVGNTTTTANKMATSTTTAGLINFVDFPDVKIVPAVNCVNAVAGSAWNTTLTPACIGGANNLGGYLPFVDASVAQFEYELPLDWDTATQPYISVHFLSNTNTSGTVIFQAAVACYKSDGSTTSDPTFNTADVMTTKTMATATRGWSTSVQSTQVTSGNSCVPGGTMLIKITRNTDTAAAAVWVTKAVITTPRLTTVQAN